jgi:[ribosomal protein S18]-alanine N-acetyltransferase
MPPTSSIRTAVVGDLPTIYRGELRYMQAIEPDQLERWLSSVDRKLELWIDHLDRSSILEVAGETVGYSIWMPREGEAVLVTIHVHPDARGAGYGRLLLERFVTDARAAGAERLTLGVHRDNPARRLYERVGFVHTGDHGDYALFDKT